METAVSRIKSYNHQEHSMTFTLSSPAFTMNGAIPIAHTCDGDETVPPLAWSAAPAQTKSFALIVDDPDAPDPKAPKRTYVHWVAYDIPSSATTMDAQHREGLNDARKRGYTGPCPPVGRHRYFFKLYALDTELGDLGHPTKADLERAMDGHVLAHAQLIGTYEH
jgi:Raf kinase inhibitor-like YbhB/YbcL family protein